LKYHLPNDTKECNFIYKSLFDFIPFTELDQCYRFSSTVAMFGSLLRTSPFVKNIGWNDIVSLAESSSGRDDLLQKEFLKLVQQAKILYSKGKKKKGGTALW